MSGRLVTYSDPLDPYDYLPDNKRDPEADPLYPLIALLIQGAIDRGDLPDEVRLDPLIADVMSTYTDKEAVRAYFNTGINARLGMYNVVLRVFKLTGLNLGITEWFNNDFPVVPFKFFVDMYEYPPIPIAQVIDLIYKIKNERSHLLAFRDADRSVCPGYFILDKSSLDSLEFITMARGEFYKGVKICWVDQSTMGSTSILTTPVPQPASLVLYESPLAMGAAQIWPANGILTHDRGNVFVSVQDAYRLTRSLFNPSLMKDRGMMAYSYGEYELGYLPDEDDPYAVELDGFTFSIQPPEWGQDDLLNPYYADSAVLLLNGENRGAAINFKTNRIYVRDPTNEAILFLQSIDEAIVDGIISFTRATPAWCYDDTGSLAQVAAGQWRLQHDPLTAAPIGYLAEPARTNLIPSSAVLASPQNATILANDALAPNGLTEMDRLVENTSNAEHLASDTIAATTGQTYIWSFYVKAPASNARYCFIRTIGAAGAYRVFDATNGAWVGAGVGPDLVDSGFEAGPHGTWRVWIKVTCSSTGSLFACTQLHNGTSNTYLGNGLGCLFFWGKDLQLGSYLTSHIPTSGVAVTRNADVMSATLSKLPYDVADSFVVSAILPTGSPVGTRTIYSVDDGTANEIISLASNASGNALKSVVDGGVTQLSDSTDSLPAGTLFKYGFACALNDFEWVRAASIDATDTVGTMPTPTTVRFGTDYAGVNSLGAVIQDFTLIPRRLSSAELTTRTTL